LNFLEKLSRIAHFLKSLIFPGQQWANAGIQSRMTCEAHGIRVLCASRDVFKNWIPAFAGMTGGKN
jgi:hypothetical protein